MDVAEVFTSTVIEDCAEAERWAEAAAAEVAGATE